MAYRDPEHPGQARDVFATATESVTSHAASGNPLGILPVRDALIFLAKAKGLPMAAVARCLRGDRQDGGLSRETAYQALRRAMATLEVTLREHPERLRAQTPCACGAPRLRGRTRCQACWREYMRDYMRDRRAEDRAKHDTPRNIP